jgi:hypothetical protein
MSHRKTDLGIPRRSKSAKVVLDRVGKIKPLPHTDAALCSSAAKFWHSLENDIADSLACSDKAAHLIESQYKDATVILAQFHCPNPYKPK